MSKGCQLCRTGGLVHRCVACHEWYCTQCGFHLGGKPCAEVTP